MLIHGLQNSGTTFYIYEIKHIFLIKKFPEDYMEGLYEEKSFLNLPPTSSCPCYDWEQVNVHKKVQIFTLIEKWTPNNDVKWQEEEQNKRGLENI